MIGIGIVAIGVLGLVTMGLWNALLPEIFALPAISFGQALGLLILSRLLFGRFGGGGRGWRKHRFARGLDNLTPEEREVFRKAMERRCGYRAPEPERQ
jgi:hypothetical protein